MTTANIDTVAASLRICSLAAAGGNSEDPSPQQAGAASAGEITVDLHSDSALPCHWEQHLNMETGEIYYINRETGVKTMEDPRTAAAPAYSSSTDDDDDDDDEDVTSDEYSCLFDNSSSDDYDEEEEEEEDDDSDTGDGSSRSASPPHPSAAAQVLVAAGCKGCFMYFMVPKHVDACPKCGGGGLLHLGRNG